MDDSIVKPSNDKEKHIMKPEYGTFVKLIVTKSQFLFLDKGNYTFYLIFITFIKE